MRSLIALGLTICVASSAAAQTEVIIRRPGEKDQVIRLDSARIGDALAKVKSELNLMNLEPLRVNTIALQSGALAAEKALAPMARNFARMMRQPHLGVVVATMARESDRFGAYIQAVTPGSPAEKAGIMSGDIVTKVGGKSLTEKDAKDDSGPGVRFISMISALTIGKPVEMELRRGTQTKTVKVTPDDDGGTIARMAPGMADFSRLSVDRAPTSPMFLSELPSRMAMPDAPSFGVFGNDGGTFGYSFGSNGLFATYELAPLNEKLGAYFGTSEGVLVVNIGDLISPVGTVRARAADSVVVRKGMPGRLSRDTSMAPRAAIAMSCDTMASGTSSTISCHGGTGGTVLFGSRGGDAPYIDGVPLQPSVWGRRMPPVDLGLQPGDVIVSVDGRKVTSPSQLMRIVGTYDHNDEFKLQIMRQKHAETLNVKMP